MEQKEILNSIKKTIDNVPIDLLEKIKTQKIEKMQEHDEITIIHSGKKTIKKLISYASVAAVLFFIFVQWELNNNVVSSRIYLDVNPSINIEMNKKDKIIALIALNKDGKKIVEGIDYKGKSVYTIIDELLNRMIQGNYISKDEPFLLLSAYNKDEQIAKIKEDKIENHIRKYLEKKSIDPIILSQKVNVSIEKEEKEPGLSITKKALIQKMNTLNPNLKVETLKNLSISELMSLSEKSKLDLKKIIDSKDFQKIKSYSFDDVNKDKKIIDEKSNNENKENKEKKEKKDK